jgi:hypothetical protein
MRRSAEAFTAPVVPPAPARTNLTLVWNYDSNIVVSFNLWHSVNLKEWSIYTNTAEHFAVVPIGMASEVFGITATNQGRESDRYFIKP